MFWRNLSVGQFEKVMWFKHLQGQVFQSKASKNKKNAFFIRVEIKNHEKIQNSETKFCILDFPEYDDNQKEEGLEQ